MDLIHGTPFHLRCGDAYLGQSPNIVGDPPASYTHILFTGSIHQALQFRLQKTVRNNRDGVTILVEHRTGYAVSIYDRYAYLSSDLLTAMPIAVKETSENGVHGYKLTHQSFGQFMMTYAVNQDGETLLGRYIRVRTPSPPYLGTVWNLEEPRTERFAEYRPPQTEVEKSPVSKPCATKTCMQMAFILLLSLIILGIALRLLLSNTCKVKK